MSRCHANSQTTWHADMQGDGASGCPGRRQLSPCIHTPHADIRMIPPPGWAAIRSSNPRSSQMVLQSSVQWTLEEHEGRLQHTEARQGSQAREPAGKGARGAREGEGARAVRGRNLVYELQNLTHILSPRTGEMARGWTVSSLLTEA
jgi:hypothetical protein